MTLIQAQDRFIERVVSCHPGHRRRVRKAAWNELYAWAEARGYDARAVCRDAADMAALELSCED